MNMDELVSDVVTFQISLIFWGTFWGMLASNAVRGLLRFGWEAWKRRRG